MTSPHNEFRYTLDNVPDSVVLDALQMALKRAQSEWFFDSADIYYCLRHLGVDVGVGVRRFLNRCRFVERAPDGNYTWRVLDPLEVACAQAVVKG